MLITTRAEQSQSNEMEDRKDDADSCVFACSCTCLIVSVCMCLALRGLSSVCSAAQISSSRTQLWIKARREKR